MLRYDPTTSLNAFSHQAEEAEKRYCLNHIKALATMWVLIQICVICLVIAAFIVPSASAQSSLGFMSIFTACIALIVSVIGTLVMRKYRTPEHHAFFLGLSFMMSMMCFLMSVASGGGFTCNGGKVSDAQRAFCAFTIFLGSFYLIFSIFLYRWRNEVLAHDAHPNDETNNAGDVNMTEMGSSNNQGIGEMARNNSEDADIKMV